MKKYLCIFMLLILMFSVVSCKPKQEETVGNDWRTTGIIDYSGMMIIERRTTDVHLCVSESGIDVYYDKPIRLLVGSCLFPQEIEEPENKITRFLIEDINLDDIPDVAAYVYFGCADEDLFVWTYSDENGFEFSEEYSETFCSGGISRDIDLKEVKGQNLSSWEEGVTFAHNVNYEIKEDTVSVFDADLNIKADVPKNFNLIELFENGLAFVDENKNVVIIRDVTESYRQADLSDTIFLSLYEKDFSFDDFQSIYGITDLGEDGIESSNRFPTPAEGENLIEKSQGRMVFNKTVSTFASRLFEEGSGHIFVTTVFEKGSSADDMLNTVLDSVSNVTFAR